MWYGSKERSSESWTRSAGVEAEVAGVGWLRPLVVLRAATVAASIKSARVYVGRLVHVSSLLSYFIWLNATGAHQPIID